MSVLNYSQEEKWKPKLVLKIMLLTILSIILIIIGFIIFLGWNWNRDRYVVPYYKITETSDIGLMKKDTTVKSMHCYLIVDEEKKLSNYNDTIWFSFTFNTVFFDTTDIMKKGDRFNFAGYEGTLDKVRDVSVYLNNRNITGKLSGYKQPKYESPNIQLDKYCSSSYKLSRVGIFENIGEFITKINKNDLLVNYAFFGGGGQLCFFCLKKDLDYISDTMQLKFEMKFSDGRIIGKEVEIYK